MPVLLVISVASVNTPHRRPYERLAEEPGWSVHVVAPERIALGNGLVKECDPEPAGARCQIHRLPLRYPRGGRLEWFGGLLPLARRLRPDVVFVEYDPGSVAVLQAFAAVRPWGGRVVAWSVENIHRPRFASALAALGARRWKEALREAAAGVLGVAGGAASARLVCINEEGAANFRERGGWKKPLAVIPLGTDVELFQPRDESARRSSLGLEGGFVIGYFGRVVPEKGVLLLVEALAQLPASFRLLLDLFQNFEPGSYARAVMDRALALGVRDRVVTIDVPHGDVPRYMSCCDALVLPSISSPRWKEQFGRVLPEAMACGVPVVGSDSGNIPALIGDAGIVVPEGDASAIARALRSLADSPELRARLSAAGRRRVVSRFSVEVQVSMLRDFLRGAP